MHKIPTLFERHHSGADRLVYNAYTPGTAWVAEGEGVATLKYDGSCCMFRDGKLYKRYNAKPGTTPPAGFEPAQIMPDLITGEWPGWLPVGPVPEDRWHREAWGHLSSSEIIDGTYELLGPKIQGNPEHLSTHTLLRHGCTILPDVPRDYYGLQQYLIDNIIEGIVWWREPDNVLGDMAKIKRRDFGLPWLDNTEHAKTT